MSQKVRGPYENGHYGPVLALCNRPDTEAGGNVMAVVAERTLEINGVTYELADGNMLRATFGPTSIQWNLPDRLYQRGA